MPARVLTLDVPTKEDVSWWLDHGGTPAALRDLVAGLPSAPAIHSAAPKNVVPAESILRFQTARAVAAMTSTEPERVAGWWLIRGAITELDGRAKAAGKTTWVSHMCRAVLDGREFMGEPTLRTNIVYLTEQAPGTFREALRRADLLERDDLHVLFWHDTVGVEWAEVVSQAAAYAVQVGAAALFVDTLPQFAGLRGSEENDAGAALDALRPLQRAAASHNLAIMVVRHERKGGGEVGDSGRGSSAFAGAVDIVLQLKRPEGNARPGMRVLAALSRFDGTPDSLVIELTDRGYVALGAEAAVALEDAKAALLKAAPADEDKAQERDALFEAAEVRKTVGADALRALVDAGLLAVKGRGVKGDARRYWRAGQAPEIHSAATPSLTRRNESDCRRCGRSAPTHGAQDPIGCVFVSRSEAA